MSINLRHTFVKDVFSLVTGQGIITILALATAVVMARALDVDGRGQFALAMILPGLLVTFSDFGLGIAATKFAASKEWIARDILAITSVALFVRIILISAIGVASVIYAGDFLFPGVPKEFLFLGLLHFLHLAISGYILPLLLGLGRGVTYNRLLVLNTFLSLIILWFVWKQIGLDVRTALIISFVAGLAVSLLVYYKTYRAVGGFGRIDSGYFPRAFRFGSGVFISSLARFAGTKIIYLIINLFTGVVGVGLFTIAQTASERVYLLADAVGTVLMPSVSQDPEKNSAELTPVVFRATVLLVFMAAGLLMYVSEWLIIFLFSDSFSGAVGPLRILLLAAIFSSGWRVLWQDLNGRGHTKETGVVNVIANIATLGLAAILLVYMDLAGAAWAILVSSVFSLLAGVYLYKRFSDFEKPISLLLIPTRKEMLYFKNRISNLCQLVKRKSPE